jgi:5-methylcytosine-specific restriction endonuclease McrA
MPRSKSVPPPRRGKDPVAEEPYKKAAIPAAVRQQVWLSRVGEKFKSKCSVRWCKNQITVFQFECGHNIPESKGGTTTLDNLVPICSNCNKSMGDRYTIDEWSSMFHSKRSWFSCCFTKKPREKGEPVPQK